MQGVIPAIEIDLGTCYFCVYVYVKGQFQAVPSTVRPTVSRLVYH